MTEKNDTPHVEAQKEGLQHSPVEGPTAKPFAVEPVPRAIHPDYAEPARHGHPEQHDPDERPLPRGPYRPVVDRGPETAPPQTQEEVV